MAAHSLAEFNRTAQFFMSWIKASWKSRASTASPLMKSKSIMIAAGPWTERELASRRCGTPCWLYLKMTTPRRISLLMCTVSYLGRVHSADFYLFLHLGVHV